MKRREFITLFAGAAATWPLTAHTQEASHTYRLGVLSFTPRNAPWITALFDALKSDGFIAGQNLTVDYQGFSLPVDQLAEHASAIVEAKVDVIFLRWGRGRPCRTTSDERDSDSR